MRATDDVITAEEMRRLEQAAIESGAVTGLELMERAGQGVVEAVLEAWPDYKDLRAKLPHRAVVLCGPGNNGGDGFVIARLLQEQGWLVDVFFYGKAQKLPTDACKNYDRWAGSNPVSIFSFPKSTPEECAYFDERASHLGDHDRWPETGKPPPFLMVDALFGIGLSRPFSGLEDVTLHWDYLTNFRDLNHSRLVAIDIPTGLNADTGLAISDPGADPFGVLYTDLTVAFHRPKTGHLTGIGPQACGMLVIKDIGL